MLFEQHYLFYLFFAFFGLDTLNYSGFIYGIRISKNNSNRKVLNIYETKHGSKI